MCSEPAADQISRAVLLDVAAAFGAAIVRDAVWYRGQCGWVGADLDPESYAAYNLHTVNHVALGPDLYSGTSGIALFLAALSAATGDTGTRRTALAAIGSALARARENRLRSTGLYAGRVGVALATAQAARFLDEEELLIRARHLITGRLVVDGGFDLISGRAGAVAGLIAMSEMLDDPDLLDRAARIGDELLAGSRRSDAGRSWPSELSQPHDLCGFAHGASGPGWALLELSDATGERRYLEGAHAAFDYERSWFDAAAANWPDLRPVRMTSSSAQGGRGFPSYWCHGAPGIALARLRAWQLSGRTIYDEEARLALDTTAAAARDAIAWGLGDFSLCHGLASLADILLHGSKILPDRLKNDRAAALEIARAGLDAYGTNVRKWPCGVAGGSTPGLFLGWAGIGYVYLRLSDPALPSPLLVVRLGEPDRSG
jgi:lantibiotic modifying enzyme